MGKELLAVRTGVDIIEVSGCTRLSAPPATFAAHFTVREQEQLAARAYKARHLVLVLQPKRLFLNC